MKTTCTCKKISLFVHQSLTLDSYNGWTSAGSGDILLLFFIWHLWICGFSRSTVKNKLGGMHVNSPGGQPVFSDIEETTFVNHILQLSEYGFPVDSFDMRLIVKSYLDKDGRRVLKFHENMPGTDWVNSFLRRHREPTQGADTGSRHRECPATSRKSERP